MSSVYPTTTTATTVPTKPNEKGLTMHQLLGQLRASKEMTEIGCLLMLVGLTEIIQPTTYIVGLVNGSPTEIGTTDTQGLPFSTLFGYVFCTAIGVVTLLVGYAASMHQSGNTTITTFNSIFVQTAYILTVSTCMNIARVARDGGSFVRGVNETQPVLEEEPNNRLLAAMGIFVIISYWFGMLGSISVLLGSLGKFQAGKGHERDGRYYGSRLFFYSFVLWLGGAAQMVIGIHLEITHGTKGGPISADGSAFYRVAKVIVSYPSMSIAVGALQVFNGTWGMLRKLGWVSQNGNAFVCSIWFGWFVQLVIQILVQPALLPGPMSVREPPELTAFCFGMNFMPAFLDAKSRSLPESIEPDYYAEETDGTDDENNHNDVERPTIQEHKKGEERDEFKLDRSPSFSESESHP